MTVNSYAALYSGIQPARDSVCANFAHTAVDGKTGNTRFYNLVAITSSGYRANSVHTTQELRNFAIKRYVLDKKQMGQFLAFDAREILQHAGKVTAVIARDHAESEFEIYRMVQNRLFESDFDRIIKEIEKKSEGKE